MTAALAHLILIALSGPLAAPEVATEPPISNRPKVAGQLRLHLRGRSKQDKVTERTADWDVAKTAIIICDMWDGHYCRSAAQRLGVMVPRMNQVITAARAHGVMVIEHIEKYWCPTILAEDLVTVVPGSAGP